MKEVHTVGTLIEYKGKILILHRLDNIPQGGTWGLPAGKVEKGESNIETAVREIFEETGLQVKEEHLEYVMNFDWHFPEVTVYFPTYRLRLNESFDVKLEPKEHSEYKWITPKECYNMNNLIHGFNDLLEKIYHVNE